MTKTICDICGKEMPTSKDTIEDMRFCILSYGEKWDICNECLIALNKWMNIRKAESDGDIEALDIAIKALEPKTGHWINGFCSKCGEEAITEWNDIGGELCLSDYCPNCGAKMVEPQESEDKE